MAAMTRAMVLAEKLTLRKADRTELSRTMAVLDLDMGRYPAALQRLKELLTHTTDHDERALQLRMLANVLLAQGDPQPALEYSDTALALANDDEVEALYARQNRARALALLGQPEQSLAQIEAVIAGLGKAGFSDDAEVILRARRYRAEILLRAGQAEPALMALEFLEKRLLAMPERREIELGQVLDLMGCALRELRRGPDAMQAHGKARTFLAKELPPDHPFLQRNTLYADVAANDAQKLRRDAPGILRDMSATSYWRRLIDVQLQPGAAQATGTQSQIFVL
jgi:tetratricopeptide (TPR) repeat protein